MGWFVRLVFHIKTTLHWKNLTKIPEFSLNYFQEKSMQEKKDNKTNTSVSYIYKSTTKERKNVMLYLCQELLVTSSALNLVKAPLEIPFKKVNKIPV